MALPGTDISRRSQLPALGGDVVDEALLRPQLAGVEVHRDRAAGRRAVRRLGRRHVGAHAARPAVLAAEPVPGVGEIGDRAARARSASSQRIRSWVVLVGGTLLRAATSASRQWLVWQYARAAGEHLLAPGARGLDRERVAGDRRRSSDGPSRSGWPRSTSRAARRGALVQRAAHHGRPHHAERGVGRVQVVDRDRDARARSSRPCRGSRSR